MKWKGDSRCVVCGKLENVDHIFFDCLIAKFVWSCFKEINGWDRIPLSLGDFLGGWPPMSCQDFDLKLFSISIVVWALWTNRNKMLVEHKLPSSPIAVLQKISFLLQKCGILLRAKNREKLDKTRSDLEGWIKLFVANTRR